VGTACHVRGAAALQDKFERTLGIKPGETTKDKKFSLETVNCVGACALGPVVVINTDYHGQVTMKKVDKLIEKINEGGAQQ
jgi:NADH:ubiquinone oxidoreductase subunit E